MKLDVETGSALDALLHGASLTVVDVGARRRPPGEIRALLRWASLVGIEPDAEEAARVQEALRDDGWRGVTIAPVAVGRRRRATLHVTAKPGYSSLLRPDAAVAGRYVKAANFEVVAEQPVDVVPLDEVVPGEAPVTIVKVDTQGTELDILQSAPALLGRTAAVLVETEFEPFYAGQPLFGDVDRHLRSHGFRLGDIELLRLRGRNFPSEVWSRRQAAWAHAVYLREVADQRVPAAHLLAAALACGFVDVGLELAATRLPEVAVDVGLLATTQTRRVVKSGRVPEDFAGAFASHERV
jgi:FkbM family methyltransferase